MGWDGFYLMDLFPEAHGPSFGRVRGLKSLGFEGPRAVWSVWVYNTRLFPFKGPTDFPDGGGGMKWTSV